LLAPAAGCGQSADAQPAVPANAIAVAEVRLADLWHSEALREFRAMWSKAGPQVLQAFDQRFVPAPSAVENLTVIVTPPPGGAGEQPTVGLYLTTSTPFDSTKAIKGLFPNAEAMHVGQATYYVDKKSDTGLYGVNPRTLLFGPAATVHALVEAPPKPGGPLEGALRLANARTPIVAGVNVAALPPIPADRVPPPLAGLLQAKIVTATLSFGTSTRVVQQARGGAGRAGRVNVIPGSPMRVNVRADFPDPEKAAEGEKAAHAGIAMLRQNMAMARPHLEALVAGKDKGTPGSLEDWPQAVAAVYGLAMMQTYDDLLRSLPLQRQESSLHTSVAIPGLFGASNPMLLGVAAGMLLPAVEKVRAAANRIKDANNLKQITLGMLNYESAHGRFPAAAICDKEGKPLLSWRVALLPYLDQTQLYQRFKLDESWDSPHNIKLLPLMPAVYRSPLPSQESSERTYYRVFVGPDAAFDLQTGRRRADITDGMSNTLLAVDAANAVPWTKPEELVYGAHKPLPRLGTYFNGGFNAVFMDGWVKYFPHVPPEAILRAFITRSGGETVNRDEVP
jgi:hypothetical protein